MLRKTAGPMREEVIREWRKLNDVELHNKRDLPSSGMLCSADW